MSWPRSAISVAESLIEVMSSWMSFTALRTSRPASATSWVAFMASASESASFSLPMAEKTRPTASNNDFTSAMSFWTVSMMSMTRR